MCELWKWKWKQTRVLYCQGQAPTEREGDGCICELDGNVQGENEEFKMNRTRLGQTKLRKRTKAHPNTVILKRVQSSGGCGRREPKGACLHGAMRNCETTDEPSDLRVFYL